jgi:carbon-monoxide dehydrogenase medium subunit
LEEVLNLLAEHGDEAKVLAGGQSLVPLMNMRLAKPSVIVDINRLPGIDYIEPRNGRVAIGALTRHRSVEGSTLLRELCPMLPEAAEHVGDLQVRNRGTFGGSISHADPAAEFCAVVFTLGGEVVARSKNGTRHLPAQDFFVGPLMTSLEPTELVTEVLVPRLPGPGWSFRSVAPRHGDLAIAGVAVTLDLDGEGRCSEVRIGMFGVGPTPLRASEAEARLKGNRLEDHLLTEVAEQASSEAEPVSDVRASASYRRELVKRLVAWNLRDASEKLRAGGGA